MDELIRRKWESVLLNTTFVHLLLTYNRIWRAFGILKRARDTFCYRGQTGNRGSTPYQGTTFLDLLIQTDITLFKIDMYPIYFTLLYFALLIPDPFGTELPCRSYAIETSPRGLTEVA